MEDRQASQNRLQQVYSLHHQHALNLYSFRRITDILYVILFRFYKIHVQRSKRYVVGKNGNFFAVRITIAKSNLSQVKENNSILFQAVMMPIPEYGESKLSVHLNFWNPLNSPWEMNRSNINRIKEKDVQLILCYHVQSPNEGLL